MTTEIKEYIKSKRPSLGESSITTYASILKNLYKNVFGKGEVDFKKFEDVDKVLKYLDDVPPNRRKTILSSLVIITDNKKYRDLMLEDVRNYNKDISKQEKTDKQEENWVTNEEIKDVYNDLKSSADVLYKKSHRTPNDLQQIQSYIIMALLSGQHIPVRRSKDYVDFRIKNIDPEKHNYISENGKELVFNSYKTAKTYGQQRLPLPLKLKNILKKWISINPTDYLLFDLHFNQLSNVKLNQRLNRLFDGKKVGVNGMRKTFLTEKFGDVSRQKKELEETMSAMGSSTAQEKTYIKLD
jgi:integrase